MVTFKLVEKDNKTAIYHYFPEAQEEYQHGIIELDLEESEVYLIKLAERDSEILVPTMKLEGSDDVNSEVPSFIIRVYADHAMSRILKAYMKGEILNSGNSYWY